MTDAKDPKETQAPPQEAAQDEIPKEAPKVEDPTLDLKKLILDQESRYKYLYAEFDNFKKRAAKERMDASKFGWESVAMEMLQVLDNFQRATAHESQDKNLLEGLKMIMAQFENALKIGGVEAVPAGGSFDPNLHEAVGQEPSDKPADTILRVETKGYTLHGRLLRPARVIVSSGPAEEQKK